MKGYVKWLFAALRVHRRVLVVALVLAVALSVHLQSGIPLGEALANALLDLAKFGW